MDPRTYHKRYQVEHMNKQHRNAVLQRLGITHLRHDMYPSDSEEQGEDEVNMGDRIHDQEYEARKAAGVGAASLKRKKRRQPTVLSAHLTETHTQVRQFYELLSSWLVNPQAPATTSKPRRRSSVLPMDSNEDGFVAETADRAAAIRPVPSDELKRSGSAASLNEGGGYNNGRRLSNDRASRSASAIPSRAGMHPQVAQSVSSTPHTPPFPFALEWLKTILGGEALEGLDEVEAQKVLRDQISRSARTSVQERNMCDTNDFGALRESILSHLGLVYFAVSDFATGQSGPSAARPTSGKSTTFLTNQHDVEGSFSGGEERPRTAGSAMSSHSRKGGPSKAETDEAAKALRARLSRISESASSARPRPQPPLINMNIARAICRPNSASVVATSSPRDFGATSALEQLKRARELRDNVIPLLTLAANNVSVGDPDETIDNPPRPPTGGELTVSSPRPATSPQHRKLSSKTFRSDSDKYALLEAAKEHTRALHGANTTEVTNLRFGSASQRRPMSGSVSSSSKAQRQSISHRPQPPTASIEVGSAHIKVTNSLPTPPPIGPSGLVIVSHDSLTSGSNRQAPDMVMASDGREAGQGLIGGEWGVGTSTWSPRSDSRWIQKELKTVSMRQGKR